MMELSSQIYFPDMITELSFRLFQEIYSVGEWEDLYYKYTIAFQFP